MQPTNCHHHTVCLVIHASFLPFFTCTFDVCVYFVAIDEENITYASYVKKSLESLAVKAKNFCFSLRTGILFLSHICTKHATMVTGLQSLLLLLIWKQNSIFFCLCKTPGNKTLDPSSPSRLRIILYAKDIVIS